MGGEPPCAIKHPAVIGPDCLQAPVTVIREVIGDRLSSRPRLHQQRGRRAMTSLQMRQQLIRELRPLGRRCSVYPDVEVLGFLVEILVDALLAGVDSCVGLYFFSTFLKSLVQ
jgi:hypothetical protein